MDESKTPAEIETTKTDDFLARSMGRAFDRFLEHLTNSLGGTKIEPDHRKGK